MRVGAGQPEQVQHRVPVAAHGQQQLDPLFEQGQPQLGHPQPLGRRPRPGQAGQRDIAVQAQRPVQHLDRVGQVTGGTGVPGLRDMLVEPAGVQAGRAHPQAVAGPAGHQRLAGRPVRAARGQGLP